VEGPLILVVEDEYPLQGLVEEALTEGGFADAVQGRDEKLQGARYRRLLEGQDERLGSRQTAQGGRS
jgi:hypothetical protein